MANSNGWVRMVLLAAAAMAGSGVVVTGADSSAQGVKYTVDFVNNSTNSGDVCIYQSQPDINFPNVMSLAWLTKFAHPTTKVEFEWAIDYSFVWDETGELKPGVIFEASQEWPADLSTTNMVHFDWVDGGFTFHDQVEGPVEGVLAIHQGPKIPANVSSVGIGMSGSGVFVFQGQPNLRLNFEPHPAYWITFGDYDQGEVLNKNRITNTARVEFPPNVYAMKAVLNKDNTWTITPATD